MNEQMDNKELAASRLLGVTVAVRFIRERRRVLRASVGDRWATPEEWEQLRSAGLVVSGTMSPPPARPRKEDACPCPGCGRCACAWVDDGLKMCRLPECICPHLREPVRLALRFVNCWRIELELRRGLDVLYTLGVWRPGRGWNYALAGDAKARSLDHVMPLLLAREAARLGVDLTDEPRHVPLPDDAADEHTWPFGEIDTDADDPPSGAFSEWAAQ